MAKRNTESNALREKKKKKKAKRLLSAPEAAARKAMKPSKTNPFESMWSRKKFDVIGKKQKGEDRRVGRARSLAVEKRKNTLLKEYEQSRKSATFVDRRIGENNDELEEFDKAIMRLQRERQIKLKKESKYNLPDGEDEDLEQEDPFSGLDAFEEDIPDDVNEDEDVDARIQKNRSFLALKRSQNETDPGLLEEESEHKTKKQVYEEIMAKSKFHKALKAKEKEEDERFAEELDNKFSSLAQSEALLSSSQLAKLKSGLKQSTEGRLPLTSQEAEEEKPDSYDMLIKAMALDMRARPSDRTKTPEEVAQEERERLEQLEEERQKRMLAADDTDDESNDHIEAVPNATSKKLNHVSGDDLGEFLLVDEEPVKKTGWADEILARKKTEGTEDENDASSDGDNDSDDVDGEGSEEGSELGKGETSDIESDSDNLLSSKDWEQSEDDLNVSEEKSLEEIGTCNNEHAQTRKKDLKSSHKTDTVKSSNAKLEPLPYVIEAPKDLTELCSLLDNRSASEVIEAIKRIRTCNAIKLSAGNRKKMQVFYGVLLQYFAVLTSRMPLDVELLNLLVKPLIEISMETPYFAAICARQRLIKTRTNFTEDIKEQGKSSWPSLKTLILLRLWSLTFPCSDFRHVVMTPAILLVCEYLMRCPLLTARDTAVGSFLCSMVLSVAKHSHKFYPEALIFLQVLLMLSTDLNHTLQNLSQCYCFMDLKGLRPWLQIEKHVSDVCPVDFFMVMSMPVDSPYFDSDDFKSSILFSVVETLKGFVGIYEGLSSFSEMFLPVAGILHEVLKQQVIPNMLRKDMEAVAQLIIKKSNEHQILRHPIQLRKQKPVPLKLLNPKFEENYIKGRDYDPDRERVERKKLKKLLKKEAKGAVRELRKDNYFLLEAKEKDRVLMEEERAEKYGKARAFLQDQEHAFKSGQLGKSRKRRR